MPSPRNMYEKKLWGFFSLKFNTNSIDSVVIPRVNSKFILLILNILFIKYSNGSSATELGTGKPV